MLSRHAERDAKGPSRQMFAASVQNAAQVCRTDRMKRRIAIHLRNGMFFAMT